MTLRSIKKILSVTLSVLFLLQQGGFVFATTNVSTWADLQTGIAGSADEYNVTTALTALPSPLGTLEITANGYSVTGASLTANDDNDPLVNIANAITFGLGNNISGSIVNNGVLNYTGSSLANGTVTGSGTFNFNGVTVTNANTINQSAVSVAATTTLTNNAEITATTFTNSGVVDNNAAITGAITNEGTLTSSADNLVGTVENNNTLTLEGGTVQSTISGTGTTNVTANLSSNYAITQNNFAISNNAYVTQNAALTAAVSNASGSTLEIDPDNLAGSVANTGTLKFNAGGALAQNITGNGLTRFDGGEEVVLDDANSIAQDTIKVGTNAILTANASNLSATTEVFNDGQLNLTGGTNANAINGDGAVEFSGTSVINNGAIDQQTGGVVNNADTLENNALITAEITNNSGKELYSTADNLNGAVHNAGSLYLKGGTTQNAIDGDGDLIINTAALSNTYNIAQTNLTAYTDFENSGIVSLENLETDAAATVSNTNSITVTNSVNNAGTINNQAGATFDNSASTGVINNTGTVNNYGTFNAYSITNDATFNNSSDLSFNDVTNNNTFHQVDGTMNAVSTTATFDNIGSFIVDDGNVYLASLTNEAGAIVNLNGGVLNAETLQNGDTITNNAVINTVNFTNNATLSGTGTTNITGDSANNGSIVQGLVTIDNNATFDNNGLLASEVTNASGSTLNSDPDNLGGNVANDGTLNLNEAGTLSINVTGAGETNIKGDLDNQGSIAQADINIDSGVVVTTNASNMTATNDIENEGIINYTGGSTNNTITGNGRVDITGYVTNTGDITQTTVSNTGVFTNNGTVTANLENSHDIEGTGSITTGTGISSNSGNITQATITNNGTFDNAGHITLTGALTNNDTFNTNADLISATGGIANEGNLNITGGTNTNTITGTNGVVNFSNTVANSATITNDTVNNTGNLTNNALITANVDNSGTLNSNAANITGDINNTGTYEITGGTNNNDITGSGTTSILGDTTNTGSITQDSVTIASTGALTTAADTVTANINNAGTLTWNTDSTNANVITGSGALVVDAEVTNNASISQESVNVSGSLTTNADLIASNNGINNTGDVILTGGTNNNVINGNGDLEIAGDVNNNAVISQDTITVSGGQLTSDAGLITAANGVTNNAAISLTGGINTNTITGNGTTYIDGTVENTGTIDTLIGVGTNGHYATESDIEKALANNGITDITGADVNAAITGTGTTNILGVTTNNSTITQGNLNIASNGNFTTDIDNVTAAIANEGSMTWNGGNANGNVVTGAGNLEITGGDIVNNAAISQGNITITSGSLTSNADLLTSVGGIANEADLILDGGTNTNVITGSGDIEFTGTTINNASVNQATITNSGDLTNNAVITGAVTNDGTLSSNGTNIVGNITNNASYIITDGDNANNITGTNGTVTIQGSTTNTGVIDQNSISIATGANLVASNMTNITTVSGIDNAGTLEMQGGNNSNTINGTTGSLKITGDVTNDQSVFIVQDNIDIATLGSLTAYADDLNTVNGITNSGALTLNDGTNNNNISGDGTLAVIGDVDNSGNISQTSLDNSGTFTSDASLLAFADGIDNSGTLNLTGGTNNNKITGMLGTTNFTGDVVNNALIQQDIVTNDAGTLTNKSLIMANFTNDTGTVNNQASIVGDITNNSGIINSTATNLEGTILNDGELNLAGGTVQADISGSGVMNITDDLVNDYTIAQATVNNDANMTNNGAITADFNNSGVVDNSAAITGAITNDGTINSTADNLVGTIASDGILNIAGGTVQEAISGSGEMNITADLVNDYTIDQTTVYNEGNLTNNNTITAANINNNGTISGAAADLVGEIANEGTLVFNTASTGASVISGAGNIQVTADTILTANNTYTGETLIDGATLTIAGQDNLVSSDVLFANDGLLHVTAAGSLDNLLKGQAATDNVRVQNDADLTLNTAMGESADFHKTGAGVMTFAMDSNGYTGNTYVDEGTLIGNTLNINNIVNGAAGTTVEFTDEDDAELNTINTLGTFVKSGSALFNVESNAFSAAQADINSGIFVANRAITADVLNVNDGATLRGNGNITGTVNVNNGGTIAPGNSIDTLTITGDVNFASGSTTAIEINETPASDLLVITGNANIDSGANLTVSNENGRYFEWESFEIVNAGNVTGEFTYDGTITDYDASRIDVEVDYSDPTKVLLVAKRKATDYETTTAGLAHNQREASKAIDAVSTGFGGDITNALLQFEALGGLNPDDVTLINPDATLKTALDDVAGVVYSNSALATLFNAKTAHVYDRIAKRNPSKGACPNCHDNVWAEYYNQYDKVYSDANSSRYTNTMTGGLAGYDRSSENVLLGVYGGFGKSDLRQNNGSKMDLEDTTLGIYGGYRTGEWLFKGTLFGGVQHYNTKRNIRFMGRTASSSYDGVNVGLDLEGSYSIPVYNWLTVRPFVGWLNNYSHQNAFTETGADDLNLHVFGHDQFNSQVRLGVQLEGKVKKFSWYGSAAVKQFVGDDYARVHMKLANLPDTNMDIISAELGGTYFSGQAGLTYALTDNWSIFGNLDTGVNNKSANCYGNIGVAFTW